MCARERERESKQYMCESKQYMCESKRAACIWHSNGPSFKPLTNFSPFYLCFARFISRRGFFWDLSVWDDETPNDDPAQPMGTDLKVLLDVARAAYVQTGGNNMIHVGGFTPWAYKYVSPHGKHQGVETEWQTMRVLSAFNIYVDADACCIGAMANAAFYAHHPLPERFPPAPFPSRQSLISKGALDASGSVVPHTYYYWYGGKFGPIAAYSDVV